MAATRIIEEERGTYVGTPRHPHQGYYAGDFSQWPTTLDGFAAAKCAQEDRSYAPTSGLVLNVNASPDPAESAGTHGRGSASSEHRRSIGEARPRNARPREC